MSRLADDSQWELRYYGIRTEIEELARHLVHLLGDRLKDWRSGK
jgi:hypothetical protein